MGRWLADGGAYLLLTGACILTLLTLAVVFTRTPGTSTSNLPLAAAETRTAQAGASGMKTACGLPGQPGCPDTQVHWLTLASLSSADVTAAVKSSDLYTLNADGRGDTPSLANLGAPQLVTALVPPGALVVPDYFDLPVLDARGAVIGVVLCELNQTHAEIAVLAVVQYAHPRASGSIAQIGAQQAIADAEQRGNITLRLGAQPRLIYFPFDLTAQETGQLHWGGGGASPDDPIWDIPGADGQDHIVGDDNQVYAVSELPIRGAGS